MRFALIIIYALLSCQVSAAAVEEFTLSNGLKILVKEDHRAPVAVVMVWYNIGSADEPGGITGVSHVLEHMMFKGTPKYALGAFSRTVAELGGEENAFTDYDYTAYYEKIAASQLSVSFELEADRMQNLLLKEEEFKKEIKVVQEERRMRTDDNPQALSFERYLATAHLSNPYHHPVIGWMSDLKQMQIGDVRAWYKNFYTPNNAVLVVIGDVKAEHVYKLADLYFGPIPAKANYVRKNQAEPPTLGPKSVLIHAPAQLPLLMFGYNAPSLKSSQKSWEPYALAIIANLLDGDESTRFTKNLVRKQRLATEAHVYYDLYSRYATQFIFYGIPAQNYTLAQLKSGIMREITNLQTQLVGADELQRVKNRMIADKTFDKDSIFEQATELGLLETIGVGWKESEKYVANLNAITPEQIQAAALRYFNLNSLTEAQLLPLSTKEKP